MKRFKVSKSRCIIYLIVIASTLLMAAAVSPRTTGYANGNSTITYTLKYPASSGCYAETLSPSGNKAKWYRDGGSVPTPNRGSVSVSSSFIGYSVYSNSGSVNYGFSSSASTVHDSFYPEVWRKGLALSTQAGSHSTTWVQYALPFKLNVKIKNSIPGKTAGTVIYNQTVYPTNVSSMGGTTFRIPVTFPSGSVSWMNKNSVSASFSGGGASLESSIVKLDQGSDVKINLNAGIAGASTGTSYIIRPDSYNLYPTVNLTLDNPGTSYIYYYSNDGNGKTVKSNGTLANGIEKETVKSNTAVNFTRNHYTFQGWKTSSGANGTHIASGTDLVMDKDYYLYAQWKQTEFQVLYYGNGAAAGHNQVPTDNQWYSPGSDFSVLDGKNLKRTGKIFAGWNTSIDGSGQNYLPGERIFPAEQSEDLKLYAQWIDADEFTLTYLNGGGNGTMPKESYWNDGLTHLITVKTPDGITNSKGSFSGWELNDGKKSMYHPGDIIEVPISSGVKNVTLTAKWGGKITYNPGNGSGIQGNVPVDNDLHDLGSNATVKSNKNSSDPLLRSQFQFRGWDTSAGDESDRAGEYLPNDIITVNDHIKLYAHWSASPIYTVEYMLNKPQNVPDENVNGSMPQNNNSYFNDGINHEVILPDITEVTVDGYEFGGWKDENGNSYMAGEKLTIKENTPEHIRLYAQWYDTTPHNITYDANVTIGEIIQGSAPVDNKNPYYGGFPHGLVIVLGDSGMKREGYQFICWNTERDGSGFSYKEGDLFHISKFNTDVILYAQWKKELIITGLKKPDKDYDGNSHFTGEITFSGKDANDEVDILNMGGSYAATKGEPDSQAETNKKVVVRGIVLGGKDADKYCISGADINGQFDTAQMSYTYHGNAEIRKRKITIQPVCGTGKLEVGKVIPDYQCVLKAGTMAPGEHLSTEALFGTPIFQCERIGAEDTPSILVPGQKAEVASDYQLTVSGLSNPNYDITTATGKLVIYINSFVGGDDQITPAPDKSKESKTFDKPNKLKEDISEHRENKTDDNKNKRINGVNYIHAKEKVGISKKKTYKMGKSSFINNDTKSVIFEDKKVPLGQYPEGVGQNAGKEGAFGAAYNCLVHWIILICTFAMVIYCIIRYWYINRKDPEDREEGICLDRILPLLAIPQSLVFLFMMECRIDICMILIFLICSLTGKHKIHKLYNAEKKQEAQTTA